MPAMPPAHPWLDPRLPPDERAALALAAMTADEKFAWLSAPIALPTDTHPKPPAALGAAGYFPPIPRLGLPAIEQTDAGLGVTNPGAVRPENRATALPSTLLLGASFDPALAHEAGALLGREARAHGFAVILAGGANLVRDPRGGRTFEYVSEDPLLTGHIAGATVAGIQSERVVSTLKHIALNAQEAGRVVLSADLDEPALRESDLLSFQLAIELGAPGALMTAYNRVNGTHASENPTLLAAVKTDWHYPGWIMSDWGGTHSAIAAARAGLDVQSGADLDPEPFFAAPLRQAVAAGQIPPARIDDMVRRILRSLFAAGIVDDPPTPGAPIDTAAHQQLAQRIAESGIVLLQNDGPLLPLDPQGGPILVIGGHADRGVLAGGGSSQVTPPGCFTQPGVTITGQHIPRTYHPPAPLDALRAEAPATTFTYLPGTDPEAAATAARTATTVILFATEWRSEGIDAVGLALPDEQDQLIAAVAAANPRTVVILETGGPVTMPWRAAIPAILAAFYPGAGGAPALAGILFGRINPAGRLPLTFPAAAAQLPRPTQTDPSTTTSDPQQAARHPVFHISYNIEGADTGYRWFARHNLRPLFPFGHGLSYTSFETTNLTATATNGQLQATCTVTNTGPRPGAETLQLYATKPGPAGFPLRLAAFRRIHLHPGEQQTVTLPIDPRLLSHWHSATHAFHLPPGPYHLHLAPNATNLTGPTTTLETIDAQATTP